MKYQKHLPWIILIISLIIGAFFRFYKLGQSPVGFYVDEASLGYNAYSILKTGKDEYGKQFPFMFRSFATFQNPVYTYLTVPSIALLGLNPFSVRLPSALFGFLSIILLYLLVLRLAPRTKHLALISAVFLALSPWHIMYSRTAYEANIALFFLLLGSIYFFDSLKKPWLLILSALFYAISFNAYRAETLIVPLLVLFLFLGFRKNFHLTTWHKYLPLLSGLLLATILIFPIVSIMRTPGFNARTSTLNIFSFSLQAPWGYHAETDPVGKFLNTPLLLSGKEFLSLYTSYFSPRYLFHLGDSGPRKPYPDFGSFFAWQFPFYLAGIYFLMKEKDHKELKYFVFLLLLISPIPAALTRDPYSTLRSLPMVIPIVLLISFGVAKFLELYRSFGNKFKYLLITFLLLLSATKLFISIFYHHDYYRSIYWNYGWQEAVSYFPDLDPTLPVLVDASRGDAYILLLFLLGYDPATYQKDNFEVSPSEYYSNLNRNIIKQIGRFRVKNFQWGVDTDHVDQYILADNIAIGEVQIKEHGLTVEYEILYPNGGVALRILRTNPK